MTNDLSDSGKSDDLVQPEGQTPIAILFKYDCLYSCAAIDTISSDSASRGPSAIAEIIDREFVTSAKKIREF